MASETEELNFFFYLILINLNGRMWLVATVWGQSTLKVCNLYRDSNFQKS